MTTSRRLGLAVAGTLGTDAMLAHVLALLQRGGIGQPASPRLPSSATDHRKRTGRTYPHSNTRQQERERRHWVRDLERQIARREAVRSGHWPGNELARVRAFAAGVQEMRKLGDRTGRGQFDEAPRVVGFTRRYRPVWGAV